MTVWAMLGSAVVLEVGAALSLKAAVDRPALYLVVAVGYIVAFALLAAILRRGMPLGVVYGIWGALGVASTAVLSWLIFGEPMNATMVLGLALVIAGVGTIEIGSHGPRRGQGVPR